MAEAPTAFCRGPSISEDEGRIFLGGRPRNQGREKLLGFSYLRLETIFIFFCLLGLYRPMLCKFLDRVALRASDNDPLPGLARI